MADPDNAILIQETESLFVVNYVDQATIVLIIYDYLITFKAEVNLFWRKEVTGATILFFFNRYITLFYHLSLLWGWLRVSNTSINACIPYLYTVKILSLFLYIPWAAFSAFRVFALANRNYFIGIIVFLLSMMPVGINGASLYWLTPTIVPVFDCTWDDSTPERLSERCMIFEFWKSWSMIDGIPVLFISRGSLIAADLIVITVTWFTMYKTALMARRAFGRRHISLASLMLRDGLVYFILLLTMNVLHLVCSLSSIVPAFKVLDVTTSAFISNVPLVSKPLTGLLVWRFMLNLQEAAGRRTGAASVSVGSHFNTGASLHFNRIIGSIGETLGPSLNVENDMASEDADLVVCK